MYKEWSPFRRRHSRSRMRHCRTARSVILWSKRCHSWTRRCLQWSRHCWSCYDRHRLCGTPRGLHSWSHLSLGCWVTVIMLGYEAGSIDRGITGSGGVNCPPPLFQVGRSKNTFWRPPPTFNVYKACLLPRLGHYHAPSTPFIHSVHYAHKIDTLMSYNPCIECHTRTAILCPQNSSTENIHQINNERKPSHAYSPIALLHFHQDHTDKMDLNVRRSWAVTVGLKTQRVYLANRRHYLNARRCANSVDCSLYSALL